MQLLILSPRNKYWNSTFENKIRSVSAIFIINHRLQCVCIDEHIWCLLIAYQDVVFTWKITAKVSCCMKWCCLLFLDFNTYIQYIYVPLLHNRSAGKNKLHHSRKLTKHHTEPMKFSLWQKGSYMINVVIKMIHISTWYKNELTCRNKGVVSAKSDTVLASQTPWPKKLA